MLSLLRNPDYCIYGLSSLRKERSLDAGEDRFNEISMQERGKFKEETLVNFGGRTKRKPGSGYVLAVAHLEQQRMAGACRVGAVGAFGTHKLPSSRQKRALHMLISRFSSMKLRLQWD